MKDVLNKRCTMLMDRKHNIANMSVLYDLIYRFIVIPIELPANIFPLEIDK